MLPEYKSIFLADNDLDDCLLFQEALSEIPIPTHLTIAHDGVELMQLLSTLREKLPIVLFLDLNMPRKNGLQCLEEIKQSDKFKLLEVVILSTSFNKELVDQVFKLGAKGCFQKPDDFNVLKKLIHEVIKSTDQSMTIFRPGNSEDSKFILSDKTK